MFSKKELLYFTGLVLLLSVFMPECSRKNVPYQLEAWRGRLLDGKQIQFSEISAPLLILNFYSPTCQPCVDELPALEILHARAQEKGAKMFIVLEGNPASHGLEDTPNAEDNYIAIRNRMIEDVKRYKISVPVAIIEPEFPVFGKRGLITGTPETIMLRTDPMVLKYNFVGPIASGKSREEILKDERLSFILSKLDEL